MTRRGWGKRGIFADPDERPRLHETACSQNFSRLTAADAATRETRRSTDPRRQNAVWRTAEERRMRGRIRFFIVSRDRGVDAIN